MPLLSPRDTNGACGASDRFQRRNRIVAAGDMSRVGARPDDNKIIPRDLSAVDAVASGDEFLLGFRIVHENQIGVVARRRLKRLTRSLSQNMHGYSGLFGEGRENVREQTRVFDRSRRSKNDRLRGGLFGGDACSR